jgi:hypothetical protein
MLDSFGRELCVIEEHPDHWSVYDPRGVEIYRDRSRRWQQLELQDGGA